MTDTENTDPIVPMVKPDEDVDWSEVMKAVEQ